MISSVLSKTSKKITINQLQKICGFLNFLGRAIVPGRAFTHRLYAYTSVMNSKGVYLKPHHHIRINQKMKLDVENWLTFFRNPQIFCRPFMDFRPTTAWDIDMYSDATRNWRLGVRAICGKHWLYQRYDYHFMEKYNPSIEYLELYALVAGVLKWLRLYCNKRIYLYCDNQSMCAMVNSTSSSCKNCMVLI